MTKKGLVVLGSTGSIGRQTLEIVRAFPDAFKVIGLSAGNNLALLESQVKEFGARLAYFTDYADYPNFHSSAKLLAMEDMVSDPEVEIVLVGTTGSVGLIPTIVALERGLTVCLANKEVLIMAGQMINELTRMHRGQILPVDSEPNAIWQCLRGENQEIRRLLITASGGPFRNTPTEELVHVTPNQALKHPTWTMGKRITIDSSTLMNKGFEVIEAHWLFDVDWDQIDVVVHPQSIIHSMVEFIDGSIKAQMGPTDMRLPIQYALLHPKRSPNPSIPQFAIKENLSITFEPLDPKHYPCFVQALEFGKKGGTYPTVLAAADEIAVEAFLAGKIKYTEISEVIGIALDRHTAAQATTLKNILAADEWAKSTAREICGI